MGRRGSGRGASTHAAADGRCVGDWAAADPGVSRSGVRLAMFGRLLGSGRRPAGGRRPYPGGVGESRPGGAGRPRRGAPDRRRRGAPDRRRPDAPDRRRPDAPDRRRPRRGMLAGGLVILVAAAGCGATAGAQSPPPSTGTGPITFAIGSDDITWLPPLLDEWNRANPKEKVTPLYLPEAANVQLDQLVANLQAKSDVYDVIAIDVVWTAEFAANGWIISLPRGEFPLNGFLGPAIATAKYRNRLYAVPYYSNAHLLFYRKDILARAHAMPPRTWAQLKQLATTVAPRYHLGGYAGTFAQYEGLTVNFAEAVQSAGGSILNSTGTAVTLDSRQATAGLNFLYEGFRDRWMRDLSYQEVSAQEAFANGEFLFLSDWPDVWAQLGASPGTTYGVVQIPGQAGPGSASLGGADLAISAYSQHQQTAQRFIKFLTEEPQERWMLEKGSFPPVLTALYNDRTLNAEFPYLNALYRAINDARPRPSIVNYDQASLVISSQVYQALKGKPVDEALNDMEHQLTQIVRDGLAAADRTGAGQPHPLMC